MGCLAKRLLLASVEFDSLVHMIKYLSVGYIITEKIMPYYPLSQKRKRMSVLEIAAEIPVLFLAISNQLQIPFGLWVVSESHGSDVGKTCFSSAFLSGVESRSFALLL